MVEDPLFWFSAVDNRGDEWRVFLATVEGCPDLCGCWGAMNKSLPSEAVVSSGREIFINAKLSIRNQDSTLLHEFMHAALDGMGMRLSREEEIIRQAEGAMFKFVAAYGNLRWPRRPRGTAELMRKARRLR